MNRPHRSTRAAAWLVTALSLAATPATARADGPAAPPASRPVLFLSDGGFLTGAAVDSEGAKVLRWKNESFTAGFWFAPGGVASVRWPAPDAPPKPDGDFLFETAGGDVLFGTLVGLDADAAELDVPPFGRVRVDRARLRRVARSKAGGEIVYAGPNGLAGWKTSGGWREEGGDLVSDVAGTAVWADLNVPARAAVELELSWSKAPNFTVALGVGQGEEAARRAFRIEVWDDDLVAVAETETDTDLAPVQRVGNKPDRVHVVVLIDRAKGRYVVVTPEGKKLADMKITPPRDTSPGGVTFANAKGDVRVERLRVSRWDGTLPDEPGADAAKARLRRTDGSTVAGNAITFDADKKQLVVTADAGATRVPLDNVADVHFPIKADGSRRTFRVVAHNGSRVAGTLVKVAGGAVWLDVPGLAGPVKPPVAALRSLHRIADLPVPSSPSGRTGVLEIDGLRLHGALEDGQGAPGSSCLVWRPTVGMNACPLRPDASGRIVYKEIPPAPPRPTQTANDVNMVVRRAQMQMRVVINGRVVTRPYEPSVPVDAGRKMIHLRTGDMIVGDVVKIDEEGVWYKSASSDNTFIPHSKLKAVELGPSVRRTVVLNRTKYDRLLTLPRLQRGSPPTHLLRSTNGDYLRGRVVGLDDKTLKVEVRLDVRDVPRDRIARITWLHADETDPAKAPAPAAVDPASTRVQAVSAGGLRLTFFADKLADGLLSGKSDVVGVCRVKLDEVNQVLFGRAIEASASNLAAQQWRLHNAPDPRFAQDTGDGSGDDPSAGTESELVGKPAPEFALDLLGGGQKFKLSEAKGTVLILDFWATWCGPCLQAMPQVDRVAAEFKDRGVRLIAVNLQETPAQITALLDRLKLHPEVALDRDGAVAARYKAVAIPQTVVVDREGKISRLFVGSSPDLADRLRDALKAATGDPSKKPEGPKK